MKRAHFLTFGPLFLTAACQPSGLVTTTAPPSSFGIPAIAVNDPCSAYTTSTDCQAKNGQCTWVVGESRVAGEASLPAACVTTSACAGLSYQACSANSNCSWSGVTATQPAPGLCPIGSSCAEFGYCHDRPPAGTACYCLQPLVCPANEPCPPVQCDCPPPAVVDGGHGTAGGGTCTCACPACGAGETCPPCDCTCAPSPGEGVVGAGCGTGAGGATGASGAGVGSGTCTCNCPECPAGASCPACSCSCSGGATTTMTAKTLAPTGTSSAVTTDAGSAPASVCGCPACPANSACAPCGCGTTPPDPCAAYTDAAACAADTADSCGWTSLTIECITTPCPTGVCARQSGGVAVDAGGGGGAGSAGCACACPACVAGQPCPPCDCNCCPAPAPVTLQPASAGAPSTN